MKGDMSDNNESKETLTLAKIWEDFTDTTGFHAVNKISFGRKHSIYRTIFWVTLWLLSAGYLVFIVSTELTHYYKYPTTITVTGRMSEELEFPAITICNIGSRNKSMFSNDTRISNYYRRLSAIADISQPVNLTDPFYVTEGYFKERTIEDLYAESKDISRFIKFQQFDLKHNAFTFTPVATDIGLCLRGNVNNTITTSLHGGLYNLHMYLDLSLDDDYYTASYLSSGIKVVVHNQHEEMLMVNQGLVVPPASEAFVEISKKQYKYLPAPYQAFENDICKQKDPQYSKSKCNIDCMRKKILNNCGCVDFMFDSENGKYCSKEQYFNCHAEVYWEVLKSGLSSCDCPFKCEYTVYDTTLSMGKFPSAFIAKDLNNLLKETEEYIKKNYISLRVYFKDLQTTVTEQKPKYEDVGDVFSNVGGQMGLFLGASILTVTELIEFMLFIIWYMCVYLTKRNVKVYTGNMTKHVQVVKR